MLNKPNRDKDSLRLNIDKINDPSINITSLSTQSPLAASPTTCRLSIQTQTQGISLATPQFNPNSPLHKKVLSSLVESSPPNISTDIPTTRDRVTSYSNNSNDIFQSEVIFEKLKVTKLVSDPLEDLRVEIKDVIEKELESLQTMSTHFTRSYITEVKSLKKELDIKKGMILQLLNSVKEISTVNITQSAKPRPIFTCENETKANNILDMIMREKHRSHLQ